LEESGLTIGSTLSELNDVSVVTCKDATYAKYQAIRHNGGIQVYLVSTCDETSDEMFTNVVEVFEPSDWEDLVTVLLETSVERGIPV
jgi:hypothetical protein